MNKLYDFLSINLGNKVTLKSLKACAYSWRQDGEAQQGTEHYGDKQ